MKNLAFSAFLALLAAQPISSSQESFWDKLVDFTVQHIRNDGPDIEVSEFISMARHHVWSRREEFVDLVIPYLKGEAPDKAAGAIAVLYRLHTYFPLSHSEDFEQNKDKFFSHIDSIVYGQLEHLHSFENDRVYHQLALYLGRSPTAESKRHLLRIADNPTSKDSKEQALICLAWHRDPKDMDVLFPYMLEDSNAARSLPYHFRNSYREAAIPYLKKALSESKSSLTQLEAAFELVHLRVPDGFNYMYTDVLQDTMPNAEHSRHLERINQFAIDYLELPHSVSSRQEIAAHIKKKRNELCKSQD
ncbi:MAG: hypothetical protein ABIH23_16960 [bacterium]